MAATRVTRGVGAPVSVRWAAIALGAGALAITLAGCGGSSPTASSTALKVTVSSTTSAHLSGVRCTLDPSGTVVIGKGDVANNGAGSLKLVLDVGDASGKTVVLPGSAHSRTISASATTFNLPVHLSGGATPANCILSVASG
jgi:hypothetical protein